MTPPDEVLDVIERKTGWLKTKQKLPSYLSSVKDGWQKKNDTTQKKLVVYVFPYFSPLNGVASRVREAKVFFLKEKNSKEPYDPTNTKEKKTELIEVFQLFEQPW